LFLTSAVTHDKVWAKYFNFFSSKTRFTGEYSIFIKSSSVSDNFRS